MRGIAVFSSRASASSSCENESVPSITGGARSSGSRACGARLVAGLAGVVGGLPERAWGAAHSPALGTAYGKSCCALRIQSAVSVVCAGAVRRTGLIAAASAVANSSADHCEVLAGGAAGAGVVIREGLAGPAVGSAPYVLDLQY